MKTFKTLNAILLLFALSFSIINPVSASQPMAPIVLDAYSMKNGEAQEINVSGLIKNGLDVLVYVDGKYRGLANISEQNGQINPFRFSQLLDSSINLANISVISKERASSVMSAPTHARARLVSRPLETKPSLFRGGSSPAKELSENTPKTPAPTNTSNVPKPKVSQNLPAPGAPTLIGPNQNDIIGTPKPLILGLTQSNTLVHVYIDGVHNGKTNILEDKSGTANFAYIPFLNLKPGLHRAWVVAENSEGKKSPVSKTIIFNVEERMISPTIITKKDRRFSKSAGLSLAGWAKDNSIIRVFVDHLLDGQFKAKGSQTGTASFSYYSDTILSRGKHLVYTTALDERGKESPWSNLIYFTIFDPKIATSTSESPATSTIGAIIETKNISEVNPSSDSETILKTKDLGNTKGISEEIQEKVKNEPVSENLKLNLIIFVLFLVAIVAWMLLVNRELAKERVDTDKNNS